MALLATSLPDGIMVKTFEDRMASSRAWAGVGRHGVLCGRPDLPAHGTAERPPTLLLGQGTGSGRCGPSLHPAARPLSSGASFPSRRCYPGRAESPPSARTGQACPSLAPGQPPPVPASPHLLSCLGGGARGPSRAAPVSVTASVRRVPGVGRPLPPRSTSFVKSSQGGRGRGRGTSTGGLLCSS